MAKQQQRWIWVLVAVLIFAFGVSCEGLEDGNNTGSTSDELNSAPGEGLTGNGSQHGPHYTLNIVGSKVVKKPDLLNPGRRIFPPLSGTAKIMLVEGELEVLDANGTDGPAEFQLPNPDPENDGVLNYSVWVRTMASPRGNSITTVCAAEVQTGQEYCSDQSMELSRDSEKPWFSEVSDILLYLYADLDQDGELERYPLFDEAFVDYYWFYDNEDLKHAQLRFYGADDDDDDDDASDDDDNDEPNDDDDDDDTSDDDDDDDDDDDGPVG